MKRGASRIACSVVFTIQTFALVGKGLPQTSTEPPRSLSDKAMQRVSAVRHWSLVLYAIALILVNTNSMILLITCAGKVSACGFIYKNPWFQLLLDSRGFHLPSDSITLSNPPSVTPGCFENPLYCS